MNPHITRLINEFSGLEVVVLGDAILDIYVKGATKWCFQKGSEPIFTFYGQTNNPGGAANTAANVASLGSDLVISSTANTRCRISLRQGTKVQRSVDMNCIVALQCATTYT